MEKYSNSAHSTALEPVETQFPAHDEHDNSSSEQNCCCEEQTPSIKKGMPLSLLIIAMLLIMLAMNAIEMHQYKQYSEVVEHEAYVLSVSINLLEDNLLFNYGLLPEDLGFGELREAWLSNACYETAMSYYEALREAWEYFEDDTGKFESFEVILV